MDNKFVLLPNHPARSNAIQAVREAPDYWVVKIGPPTRNLDQNALFHSLCGDVAKSGIQWMGKPRSAIQWKSLFVSGHAMATGLGADVMPGLEGEFVNLRESTATMSKKRATSLIEYVLAWCAENEVKIRLPTNQE